MLDSNITQHWKLITEDESVDNKEIPIQDGLVFGREAACDIQIVSEHVSRQHAQLEVLESLVRIKDLESANGTFINGCQVTEAELNDGDILSIDTVKFTVFKPMPETDDIVDDKTRVRAAVDINKTMLRPAISADAPPQLIEEDREITKVLPTVDADDSLLLSQEKDAAESQAHIDLDLNEEKSSATTIDKEWQALEEEFDLMEADNESVSRLEPSVDMHDEPLLNTFELDRPVASLTGKSKPFMNECFDITSSPTSIGRIHSNDIILEEASISSRHAELRFEKGDWYIYDQDSYNGTYVNKSACRSHKLEHGDIIRLGRVQLKFEMLGKSKSSNRFQALLWPGLIITVLALLAAIYFLK